MKTTYQFLCTLFMLVLIMGCNQKSKQSKGNINPSITTKYYSESQLGNLIIPGMTVSDATNMFGLAGATVKVSKEREILIYTFRSRMKQDDNLTGFTIDTKDERIVRWAPIKGSDRPTSSTFNSVGPKKPLGEQSFGLFLVNDDLTNVANIIDSKGSADASDLKTTPDITFIAKTFIGDINGDYPNKKAVLLVVGEQDGLGLKNLTENNMGKRLLIVVQNRAIAAPVITVPLASRQLEFTVKDASVLSVIQGR